MSDAPERIWAWFFVWSERNDHVQGGWTDKLDERETEYVRADIHAAALARAERAEAELAKLADPNAVHVSMLAGTVAKPSWQQIKHIYAEEAERAQAALAEAVEALREADRFMAYFSGETGGSFTGGGTPVTCLSKIRAILARIQGDSHE